MLDVGIWVRSRGWRRRSLTAVCVSQCVFWAESERVVVHSGTAKESKSDAGQNRCSLHKAVSESIQDSDTD